MSGDLKTFQPAACCLRSGFELFCIASFSLAMTASTFKKGEEATPGHPLWWVGYRKRLGDHGSAKVSTINIPLSGRLDPTDPTAG